MPIPFNMKKDVYCKCALNNLHEENDEVYEWNKQTNIRQHQTTKTNKDQINIETVKK